VDVIPLMARLFAVILRTGLVRPSAGRRTISGRPK
jgi:hypothetical protein